jgi:nucleotide-binding universal stress UspA family protein
MRSIMVPVDGSNASLVAVALACDIARRNKGKVYVVHVIEVKRTMPLDAALEFEAAASDEIISRAERLGSDLRCQVEGEILQARQAGHAIVDEAIERSADLVILGLERPDSSGEFQVGPVADYVLKNAPCEVWVCRRPAGE